MAQVICEGRKDVEVDSKTERPPTSKTNANINKVCQLVYNDHLLTIYIMADELGIAYEMVRTILVEKLGMQKVWAKMVPLLLTPEQKACLNVFQDILQQLKADNKILERIIKSESQIFQYNPETK